MLTNAALLKLAGLIVKQTNGKFILGPNATKRHVFLYGDGFSVNLYSTIYDKILRQITRLGNEEYVGTLLDAQDRIFIQKGAFHQCMHHLASIYTQFYGGFLQPFQVANSVKRVTGNPLKQSAFQCHEQFATKLNNACNQFMLHMYVHTCYHTQFHDKLVDSLVRMCGMIEAYRRYCTSWERSDYEPSRVISLYLKSMRSYNWCRNAIQKHDPWHLEIESCKLMPVWRMTGKTTYLRPQCKYMEMYYNDKKSTPCLREIMRANNFCVKPSGRAIAFGKEN